MEKEKIIDLVKKLLAVTESRGATPAEAATAAAKAQQLLAKHGLSADRATVDESVMGQVVDDSIETKWSRLPVWADNLAHAIAIAFGCRAISGGNWVGQKTKIIWIGRQTSVAACIAIFPRIANQLGKSAHNHAAERGYKFSRHREYVRSFLLAASCAILDRVSKTADGRALVACDRASIDRIAVEKFNVQPLRRKCAAPTDDEGTRDGRRAGQAVSLAADSIAGQSHREKIGFRS
jgi:hypothetical protein